MKKLWILVPLLLVALLAAYAVVLAWPTKIDRALVRWERSTNWECYAKYGRLWELPGTYTRICYGQNSTGTPVEIFRSVFTITYDKAGIETGFTTQNYSIKGEY